MAINMTCILGMQGQCKSVANSQPHSNARRLGRGQPDLGQLVELAANLEGQNESEQAFDSLQITLCKTEH